MKKIKWIGLVVIISVIPLLIAAQGDDKGAGPPKKEEAKPPVKAPPKVASPTKPAQPSKPGPYAYLVVRTDLDVVLDVGYFGDTDPPFRPY